MSEENFRARRQVASPLRWLFPLMALGGLTTSLGPLGKWIGLAIFAPLIAGFWWRERLRWRQRRAIRQLADFEPLNADEFRAAFDGFELLRGTEIRRRVRWDEIYGIAAFIDFQINGDALALGLRLKGYTRWLGIPADVEGFYQLRLALRERFGVPHGWDHAVWSGPRGLNWRSLWGEAPPPGELCWNCGYSLEGNKSGVCPECGTCMVWPEREGESPAD